MNVLWMRHRQSRIVHAFAEAEVTARLEPLEPIMNCGRYRFVELVRDELAERCAACVRAALKAGQQ